MSLSVSVLTSTLCPWNARHAWNFCNMLKLADWTEQVWEPMESGWWVDMVAAIESWLGLHFRLEPQLVKRGHPSFISAKLKFVKSNSSKIKRWDIDIATTAQVPAAAANTIVTTQITQVMSCSHFAGAVQNGKRETEIRSHTAWLC